ncbi:putative bifunctional diguanylate cyclase/phosphodiesterase [Aquamicrobium zhengzhouense]|uniref:putative bifunctional diguanylate cyclase/phosphodiesterase n=1 Tax=Aquamicrobium zhengzhouense TaxID=2781738 RepID=UPI001AED7D19|nr:EAL domain-containing protein [Aquamicrobium zhengzhouense]
MSRNTQGGVALIRVFSCLADEHDHSFVLVAALVCLAGSAITLQLYDRARRRDTDRVIWTILSGIAGGTAIWSTHFVGMLGFNPPVDHAYEPVLTLTSLAAAILFTISGLHIAISSTNAPGFAIGGALIGVGICVMHFLGMAGLTVAGTIEYDPVLVLLSLCFAVGFSSLALVKTTYARNERGKWIGFGALVLAICTMHFTAMGSATFLPGPDTALVAHSVSSELLAITVVAAISVATGIAIYVLDVRSHQDMVETYRHASLHDPLTGLPNRGHLATLLPEVLHAAERARERVGLLVLDLDRFKQINDVHGHLTGDEMLRHVSASMMQALEPNELLARLGGDEFVTIRSGNPTNQELNELAARLSRSVSTPLPHTRHHLSVGASIGIAIFPDHAQRAEELLAAADLAMYRSKAMRGRDPMLYDPLLDEANREKSCLGFELQRALARDEFDLYYQPLVDTATRNVIALEALLRWRHPTRGLLQPGQFLPVAERHGLMLEIGNWALQRACADAVKWPADLRVSVNIAAAQILGQDLPTIVSTTLERTGLPADRLEIEITEDCITGDPVRALEVVRRLKAQGTTIAMDDYGTGYSSLANLRIFPFDKLKIDRAFVMDVTENHISSAIVKSTVALARDLGIQVTAEGVEREEHFLFLQSIGCTSAQGYLFGKPAQLSSLDVIQRETAAGANPVAARRGILAFAKAR